MTDQGVTVVGAGGHAKVVIASLVAAGHKVVGVLDDDREKWGTTLLGIPVQGGVDRLATGNMRAIIAIGDNAVRLRIAAAYPKVDWITVVHPSATLHESVRLGRGVVVFAGSIVQPDTVVGDHVILNTGCTVDHDCVVGDFVHVAPGVHIAGGVSVGQGSLIGVGAAVVPRVRIGDGTTVGAGAVVVRDLPAGVVAIGVPAVSLIDRK